MTEKTETRIITGEYTNVVPKLLTREEAAEILKVSPRTVDNMVKRKELSKVKVGRRVMIVADSIKKFIDYNRTSTIYMTELDEPVEPVSKQTMPGLAGRGGKDAD